MVIFGHFLSTFSNFWFKYRRFQDEFFRDWGSDWRQLVTSLNSQGFWVFSVKRAFSREKRGSVKSGGLFGCCSSVRVRKSTVFSSSGGLFCYNILGFSSQEGLFSWENKGFCEVRRTFWVLERGSQKYRFFEFRRTFLLQYSGVFQSRGPFLVGKQGVLWSQDFLGAVRALGFAKVLFFSGLFCYILGFSSQEGIFSWENKGFCEVQRTFWVLFER